VPNAAATLGAADDPLSEATRLDDLFRAIVGRDADAVPAAHIVEAPIPDAPRASVQPAHEGSPIGALLVTLNEISAPPRAPFASFPSAPKGGSTLGRLARMVGHVVGRQTRSGLVVALVGGPLLSARVFAGASPCAPTHVQPTPVVASAPVTAAERATASGLNHTLPVEEAQC
jgi:hypothetical protein